jgi:RNA polymerase sigma-54 factor
MNLSLSQSQRQEQVMSPQMLQRMALLTVPITELQTRIQKEVEENPALEIPDEDISDIRLTSEVPQERSSEDDPETSSSEDYDGSSYEDSLYDDGANMTSGDFDSEASDRKNAFIENTSRDDETVSSYLMQQLGTQSLDPKLFETASIIITSLDSNGFFTRPLDQLVEDPELQLLIPQAVELIQEMDPPGVCVPDYKESLILQAKRKGLHPEDLDNFADLIRNHFQDLKPGRFAQLSKDTGIPEEDIQSYYDFLRTLSPYPGSDFASGENSYVVPELSIKNVDGNLVLSLNKASLPNLTLSPDFSSLADGLKGEEAKETSRFISDSVGRAKLLISQIELRYNTLYKTALALMELQRDFFLYGPSHLKPLTLSAVAQKVGVHETTISRISQSKWIDTDWGLMQMKSLFSQGLQTTNGTDEEVSSNVVKQKIQKIIESNDTGKKLSDQKIADKLTDQGIKIARRTVSKYRKELNLDSSYER